MSNKSLVHWKKKLRIKEINDGPKVFYSLMRIRFYKPAWNVLTIIKEENTANINDPRAMKLVTESDVLQRTRFWVIINFYPESVINLLLQHCSWF